MNEENYNTEQEIVNVNHLEPSTLQIGGANGKPVKLYKYVGTNTGSSWESVKDYFFYVTPEFVLREGVTGFRDYGDIAWYCKKKDIFIIEERLNVPVYLSIGYKERVARSEAHEWYESMSEQNREKVNKIKEIKSWFTEAVYPESVRDYVGDVINSSRVYLPSFGSFFEEGGVAFLVREDQDFIGMFVNLEFTHGLGNCRGVLNGIFCYLDFDVDLADLINDWCVDETDDFRELYVRGRDHYVYRHEPCMKPCVHPHKFHSGCAKGYPKEVPCCHIPEGKHGWHGRHGGHGGHHDCDCRWWE